jgi:hypothetical protein
MVSYDDNPELLEDHGDRFICILFFLAKGVRGWPLNADKVFDELGMEEFKDQPQARAELVQFLEQQQPQRIQYDGATNMVRLTDQGLEWARECNSNTVFIQYRHLQN